MNHLIFEGLGSDERFESVSKLAAQAKASVIIYSQNAARLANTIRHPEARVVVKLFRSAPTDAFNPLDVLRYMTAMDSEIALSTLLESLRPDNSANLHPQVPSGLSGDSVWSVLAVELFESVVRCRLQQKNGPISLIEAINDFFLDDIEKNFKSLLDDRRKLMDPNIYSVISAFLKRSDPQKSAILSLVQGAISYLNSGFIQQAVERTTFDLDVFSDGGATVYVEVPNHLSHSGGSLGRLWLSAFIQLAASERAREHPVLFIFDNAAGLDIFPQLLAAQHLPAGSVETWSFWESLGQISIRYPADWSAFVGSSRGVQALGPQNPVVAAELANAFGVSAAELIRLAPGSSLSLSGEVLEVATPAISPEPRRELERGHIVTFTPSHADKWGGVAASILREPKRSVVVVESAGRCYAMTAAERAAVGRVIRLDPFGVLGETSDQFNPFDLLKSDLSGMSVQFYEVAELLINSVHPSPDHFWNNYAVSLTRALLQYMEAVPDKRKTLGELWSMIHADDPVYNLAVVLDTIGKRLPAECYREISVFLQRDDNLRTRILSEVAKSLAVFGIKSIQQAVERTTFDLDVFSDGGATVYVEVPNHLSHSGGSLGRLWLSAFIQLAASERAREHPVLFIFDNAAGLDIFPQLLAAQHLPAGSVETWSFWESLGQISIRYPADWSAFVGSSRGVQALGPQNPVVAAELANAFGVSAAELIRLAPGSSLSLSGEVLEVAAPAISPEPRRELERGHIVTFTPSHADKWGGVAASILREPKRSVVVVESAGRCYAMTAAERAAVGRVIRLDPFGVLGETSDQFNPFDLLKSEQASTVTDEVDFAELMVPSDPSMISPLWRVSAVSLLQGILSYLSAVSEKDCSFVEMRKMLSVDDPVYQLAVVLDSEGKQLTKECYGLLSSFLAKGDAERASVMSIAYQALRIFADPRVADLVESSSFNLLDFTTGTPMTIYIELPISRLPSHTLLLQLWIKPLLALASSCHPAFPPVLIFENPFSKALFSTLAAAQNSVVADIWTFWDSLDQLRIQNESKWSAFLANASRIETIGPQNHGIASQLASLFGNSKEAIQSQPFGKTLVLYDYNSA